MTDIPAVPTQAIAPQPATPQPAPAIVDSGAIALSDLKVETVLFRNLGNRLPIGPVIGGQHFKTVEFKPYTPEIEMRIGRTVKSRSSNNVEYMGAIAQCLDAIVESLGVVPTNGSDPYFISISDLAAQYFSKKASWLFDSMSFVDLLAIIFMARVNYQDDAEGYEVAIRTKCEAKGCSKEISQIADISEMEIGVINADLTSPLEVEVLLDGFTMYEGTERAENVQRVRMAPVTLRGMKAMTQKASADEDRFQEIQQMVTAMPDAVSQINASQGQIMTLDYWKRLICNRKDKARMYRAHEALGLGKLGPRLTIPMRCPCAMEYEWETLVPWRSLANFWFDLADAV